MNTKNLLTFVAMAVLVGAIVSMTTSGVFAQSNNSNQDDEDHYNGSLIDRIMAQQGNNNNENNNDAGGEEDCVEENEEGEEEDADEAEDEDEEGDVDEADDEECSAEDDEDEGEKLFTTSFMAENCTFTSTGTNPFFILEPGYRLVLAGEEDGELVEMVITVLNEKRIVDGIETRVVEEREWVDGELVEVSTNFIAICGETNSVFYFGEEVDDYEDGELVSHEGEWLAGKDNATAGILMPGTILLGSRYQQETAPGVAMDRAEIMSMNETIETPAGTFSNVLAIKETNPLESGEEFKYHVAGIGLIQDENLKLEEYGFVE
ncbi:MAG TPA: hypothetical protein VFS46_00325 [Nitrososphaera sp.]|nr:hypothetical protein [Nitrososphaera sp.]